MGKILLHSVRVGESVNYTACLSSLLAIRRDFHAYHPVKNCSSTPTTVHLQWFNLLAVGYRNLAFNYRYLFWNIHRPLKCIFRARTLTTTWVYWCQQMRQGAEAICVTKSSSFVFFISRWTESKCPRLWLTAMKHSAQSEQKARAQRHDPNACTLHRSRA